MSNESVEPWQKMMDDWQQAQASISQQMMDNMQKWNAAVFNDPANTQKPAAQLFNNPLLDTYQSFLQTLLKSNPLYSMQSSNDWQNILQDLPGTETLLKQMNDLLKGSKDVLEQLKNDFIKNLPDDSTREYFLTTLTDISNPYNWLKYSSTNFDEGVKRFSEGPLFSGISDIDTRMAKATDGWLDLTEKNREYYEVLLKNWTQAYERFLNELKELQANNDGEELSPRKLVELWSSIANDELMLMHRSEEFLNTQRELIKASAEYRLYEQDIAEVVCEAMHIPTRQEVDDLHKTMTELKREVRSLRNQVASYEESAVKSKPKKKPAAKKPSTKKQTDKS